jgi:hypothetical protein
MFKVTASWSARRRIPWTVVSEVQSTYHKFTDISHHCMADWLVQSLEGFEAEQNRVSSVFARSCSNEKNFITSQLMHQGITCDHRAPRTAPGPLFGNHEGPRSQGPQSTNFTKIVNEASSLHAPRGTLNLQVRKTRFL